MLHTFSPNWYRPQCLCITKQHFYYASNYLLYEYNLKQRKVSKELCLRQIAIELKLNFKDIKIVSIVNVKGQQEEQMIQECKEERMELQVKQQQENVSDKQKAQASMKQEDGNQLYIAINQPYIFHIQVSPNSFSLKHVIILEANLELDMLFTFPSFSKSTLIFTTPTGSLYTYSLITKQVCRIPTPQIHLNKDRVKQIYQIQDHLLVFCLKGTIAMFNNKFTKAVKCLKLDSQEENILCVDKVFCEEKMKWIVGILSKGKSQDYHHQKQHYQDNYNLYWFGFEFNEDFPKHYKKKVIEIASSYSKISINFHYPKKLSERLKQYAKAALSIKMLNSNQCILTGKLGQVYTLYLTSLKTFSCPNQPKPLILKPYSYNQDSEQSYEVWSDSKHYKQIYSIKVYQDVLYFLSTDHNLSIWNISEQTEKDSQKLPKINIKPVFSIKFLTTGVSSIFFSDADPINVLLLLRDSIIRSFSPLEEGNHYLNQHWKHTKKYKVRKVCCHLTEPGILAMQVAINKNDQKQNQQTNSEKIIIYDIYEDRLIKIIQLFSGDEEIISISFQNKGIATSLIKMYQPTTSQIKQQKDKKITVISQSHSTPKVHSTFQRLLPPDIILLIQLKSKLYLVNFCTPNPISTLPKSLKLQRLDRTKYWNGQTLLSSQYKSNQLKLIVCHKDQRYEYMEQSPIDGSARVIFKLAPKTQRLLVIYYRSTKMIIVHFKFNHISQMLEKVSSTNVTLSIPIDHLVLDPDSFTAAIYNQRDNLLQILTMATVLQNQDQTLQLKIMPTLKLYTYPTKIQCLSFYLLQYLIIGSKDQAVKVVRLQELQQAVGQVRQGRWKGKNKEKEISQPKYEPEAIIDIEGYNANQNQIKPETLKENHDKMDIESQRIQESSIKQDSIQAYWQPE